MELPRREPPSDSRYGCAHPLEACHLFSLPFTAPRKERLAELKDGCGGVFLFRSLSEGVGYCRDTPVPAWTVSRWKETEAFFPSHIQIQKYDSLPVYVKVFQKKK